MDMIKVHLILGFLGAGKTTFLRKVIQKSELRHEKLLLIVNDYGPENYDAQALKKDGIEVTEINNGCLCCSNNNQFEKILFECASRNDIDRIFIEPSGLFIPDQVLTAFQKEAICSSLQLEPIITILDYAFLAERKIWPPSIDRLVETGQLIVRNKLDKVRPEAQRLIDEKVVKLNRNRLYNFGEAVDVFIDFRISKLFYPHEEERWELDHEIGFRQIADGLHFLSHDELMSFLTHEITGLIRAKGNVRLAGKVVNVNFVNRELQTKPSTSLVQIGLSCFVEQVSVYNERQG
jgi:G3E family GTPase